MAISTSMNAGRSSMITDIALATEDMKNPGDMSSDGTTLVRTTISEKDRLISDEMGSEVVQVLVGAEKKVFTVHRNLLVATGDSFLHAFDPKKNPKGRITMSTKSADVFKLFVDMIYTRQVPAFTSTMSEESRTLRLKGLCELYVYAEELELKSVIKNQIFDRIQDGFYFLDKLPEVSLISLIYRNAPASSQLRKFMAACLVYQVRKDLDFEMDTFVELFKSNEEIIKDFLAMVHYFVPGQDPRNYEEWPECAECISKASDIAKPPGVWPCSFHVHTDIEGTEPRNNEDNCHLGYK